MSVALIGTVLKEDIGPSPPSRSPSHPPAPDTGLAPFAVRPAKLRVMPLALAGALLAAFLTWAAYPPWGQWYLVMASPIVLLAALTRVHRYRDGFLVAGVYGTTVIAGTMYWISGLADIALPPLAAAQGAVYGLFGIAAVYFCPKPTWAYVGGVTGSWAAMEFLRARWPVGGLGWGALGYPLGELEAARTGAAWIGTTGWAVLLVALAAAVMTVRRAGGRRILGVVVGAVSLLLVAGALAPSPNSGDELTVTIVQGNSPCPRVRCPNERALITENHLRLTQQLEPGSVDLVVWAESSTGFNTDPLLNNEVRESLVGEAARLGAYIMVGSDRPAGPDAFFNSNIMFAPDGTVVGEYRKNHPVPFGEYVPGRPFLSWIPELSRVPRDMTPGDGPEIFVTPFGPVGSVISFEGAFARYMRENADAGAGLLVIATNEASYGDGPAADQLIWKTRMRSAETGLDVVHAAITGKSAFITDGGVIGSEVTPLFEEAILEGVVEMRDNGRTLFVRWGDWLAVLAMLAGGVAFTWTRLVPGGKSDEPD